ncbi:MAG TPA: DUF2975 domain-containing protein [Lacibacter sp.]|nr:DUF2975 domain-containing protein [Lacibacter sp.]HMO87926.1 DUF2975 domain-containing protein [Lacibacter sp.]
MKTSLRIKRIALALRLYLWISALTAIFFMLNDIISGFSNGYNARENGFGMRHILPVTPTRDTIWYEDTRLAVMGVQNVIIREKRDAPALPVSLRVIDWLLTLGAFAIIYLVIRLLRTSLALMHRFENNAWLQDRAIGELMLLGRLFFLTGLSMLCWELLHGLYLRQVFAVPGYSHRLELANDFSWLGMGLILWGIASVLQYTRELQEDQNLTI